MGGNLKLRYKDVGNGNPFMAAMNEIANQSFGGKQDAALLRLLRVIKKAAEEYSELTDKAKRQFGTLDPAAGGYTLKGISTEKLKEFDEYMLDLQNSEFELPILEPIRLVRRKSHILPPVNAALVADVIEVVWPDDDGEHLDKDPEPKK